MQPREPGQSSAWTGLAWLIGTIVAAVFCLIGVALAIGEVVQAIAHAVLGGGGVG